MADTSAPPAAPTSSGRRVILAGATGNLVEWFDFTIYGFSAAVIAKVFFPPDAGTAALLGTFAVYGVAFLARPLGAVFFGRLGDRLGRRSALGVSIVTMGAATAAISLLPGWDAVGVAAPVLLLAARLVQGFSAGGEYTGALTFTVEHAPANRRGLWLSLVSASTWLGVAGATVTVVTVQSLAGDAFATGAWRWPFAIGGLVSLVGLFLRLRVDETPVFAELEAKREQVARPFRELVRGHWRTLLVLFVYYAAMGVLAHMFLGFMPTYLGLAAGVTDTTSLWITTALALLAVITTPILGMLMDRVGRRPIARAAAVGAVVVCVPAYLLIGTGSIPAIVVALLAMLVVVGLLDMISLAVLELYPASVRFSGMALPYNLAYALFAGTAPLVGQFLVDTTGSLLSPAWYATALGLIALPVLLRWIPETRSADLRTGFTR